MSESDKRAKKMIGQDFIDEPFIAPSKTVKKSHGRASSRWLMWAAAAVVVLALAGTAGFFYKKYNDVKSNPADAISEKNKAETDTVLASLKKRLLISETDAPTVARVEDPEKLKTSNAEFYKDVQNGDYLVIFPKRAIIYRQSNDQIINVAPIINTADLKKADQPAASTPANNQ